MPAESGASCAFAASIKRAAALREGPLPFAVPVAVNLRRMSLLILISVPTRVRGKFPRKGQLDTRGTVFNGGAWNLAQRRGAFTPIFRIFAQREIGREGNVRVKW